MENVINQENFRFIEHDITDYIDIECDQIYNLACPASPVQYQNNPISTLKTNVMGAYNLLELAVKNEARIFKLQLRSVWRSIRAPQKESYWGNVNPIGIRSCYDEGKRCAGTLFFDYHRGIKFR